MLLCYSSNGFKSIEQKKEIQLYRLISALGIRHIGNKASRTLAKHFKTLTSLMKASREQIIEIPEIGPVMAESIIEFFTNTNNINYLNKLQNVCVILDDDLLKPTKEISIFNGKKFVLTGNLNNFTRKEAEEKIINLGATCSSSVSSKTDYVIAGDNPGSKLQKAKELNIKILNENDFIDLIKE